MLPGQLAVAPQGSAKSLEAGRSSPIVHVPCIDARTIIGHGAQTQIPPLRQQRWVGLDRAVPSMTVNDPSQQQSNRKLQTARSRTDAIGPVPQSSLRLLFAAAEVVDQEVAVRLKGRDGSQA
jgi:hypothetical protein